METGKGPASATPQLSTNFRDRHIESLSPSMNMSDDRFVQLVAEDFINTPLVHSLNLQSNPNQSIDSTIVRTFAWGSYYNCKRFGVNVASINPDQLTTRISDRIRTVVEKQASPVARTGT